MKFAMRLTAGSGSAFAEAASAAFEGKEACNKKGVKLLWMVQLMTTFNTTAIEGADDSAAEPMLGGDTLGGRIAMT